MSEQQRMNPNQDPVTAGDDELGAEQDQIRVGDEQWSPEQEQARKAKANRATRGGLAAILCLEAFVVLLVPRAIAQTSTGLSSTTMMLLAALAVVLIMTGFLLRRPWGVGLGTALQAVLALTVVLEPAMAVIVIVFAALWLYLLQTRHELLGTPSGWRKLIS
jgi:hypothetical protein